MDTPLLGFSHIQLRVRDVDASRDWYSTVLGIEPYRAARIRRSSCAKCSAIEEMSCDALARY